MERKGLVYLLFLALAGPGAVCAAEEAALLQVGVPVIREIHGGELHTYPVHLNAGDYAHIEADPKGFDVMIEIFDPAGTPLVQADLGGRDDVEVASVIAGTAGDFKIEVKPYSREAEGSYLLALKDLRPAEPGDRLRVEAEKADRDAHSDLNRGRYAVERWREAGDRQGEAWALTRLGDKQNKAKQFREGLATCDQALALHRLSGNRAGIAESLYQIGKASGSLGDRARALAAHQEAISLWQQLGQPSSVARGFLGLGNTHKELDESDDAMAAYQQAVAISRDAGDREVEFDALNTLGQLQFHRGQPRQALDAFRAALELSPSKEKETEIRQNLGALYRDSLPREALKQFAASARIFQDTGQTEKQCVALNNLGSLLIGLGALEEAREHYSRALSLCQEPGGRSMVLLGLGRIEDLSGNFKEAEARLDEAQELQKNVRDRAGEADTLRLRGFLFLRMSKPAQARNAFNEALGLMERTGKRSTEASVRRGLARAEADLGNLELAREGFEKSRAQAEEMGSVSEQALALAEAGRLEHEAGRLPEARARLEAALRLAESFQLEIGGEGLRAQHFAKVRETYERYVDVLMQLHRAHPDTGLLSSAFEYAERSRARSLLDVLTRAQIDTQDGDPALKEREIQLRLELNAKATARMTLPPGPEREAVDREIQALSADFQVVEARLAGSYLELTKPSVHVADIQALLDDGTVLLEYLLGDVRSYLWVVSRDSLASYELPPRREVEEMASRAHQLLSSPSERDPSLQRKALDELSRTVIAPALAELAGKRLVIVADGALQYVPFAALPIPSSELKPGMPTVQPLLAEHETVLLPSAGVLREIRRAREARPASTRSLAILANPSYSQGEPKPPAPLPLVPEVTRGSLAPLVWSEQEAKQIAGLAEGYEVLTALGPAASRELAMSGRLSHYSLLHFATHGYLDSEHPELSGLALASVDKDGHAVEGFLRLQDLYSLHLQSDLIVLSGCETGLGRDRRGEGLQSLTHGFFHAGASQVIASLWPVRDRAATELMLRLYQAMLRDGKRPSAALREAQLGMLGQRPWHDAYFWAAFVAQGDWLAGPDTADTVDTPPAR